MMKTIIAGSRNITKEQTFKTIESCFWKNSITTVISGTANGPDKHGEQWAKDHWIPIEKFPADWNHYGKSAGMIRNKQMAKNADALIAVWDGISKGTFNMIEMALLEKLKIMICRPNSNWKIEYFFLSR